MPEFSQLEQSDVVLNRGTKNTQLLTLLLGKSSWCAFLPPAFQRKEGEQGQKVCSEHSHIGLEMFSSGAVGKGRLAAQTGWKPWALHSSPVGFGFPWLVFSLAAFGSFP